MNFPCYFCQYIHTAKDLAVGTQCWFECYRHTAAAYHAFTKHEGVWRPYYVSFEGSYKGKPYSVYLILNSVPINGRRKLSTELYCDRGVGKLFDPVLTLPFLANWTPENINDKLPTILTFL